MTPAAILAEIATLTAMIDRALQYANSPGGQALSIEFAADMAALREHLEATYAVHKALAMPVQAPVDVPDGASS